MSKVALALKDAINGGSFTASIDTTDDTMLIIRAATSFTAAYTMTNNATNLTDAAASTVELFGIDSGGHNTVWTNTVDGSTSYTYTTPGTGPSVGAQAVLDGLVSAVSSVTGGSYAAAADTRNSVTSLKLVITGPTDFLSVTVTGNSQTINGTAADADTVDWAGATVNNSETWSVTVNGIPYSYQTAATGVVTPATVVTGLASLINADSGVTYSAGADPRNTSKLIISGGSITSSYTVTTAATNGAGIWETTAAVTGSFAVGQTVNLTVNADPAYSYTVVTGNDAAAVAAGLLAELVAHNSGSIYTAALDPLDSTKVVISQVASAATTELTKTSKPPATVSTVSGSLDHSWLQDVTLLGTTTAADTWTLTIGGKDDYTCTGITTLADVAAALASKIGSDYSATSISGTLTITAADGSPVPIEQVKQLRAAAAGFTEVTHDSRQHFNTVEVTLDSSARVVPGEKWSVTVNGKDYTYTVPNLASAKLTLNLVAKGLAAKINEDTAASYKASLVPMDGYTIVIEDKNGDLTGPSQTITTKAGRGGSVHAIFDIDKGNYSQGTQAVITGWQPIYFYFLGIPIVVGYTPQYSYYAYVDKLLVTLMDASGNTLATTYETNETVIDAGSTSLYEPFLEYDIKAAGTYRVKVGSYRDYQPNPYFADTPPAGVMPGLSYNLNVSLQRHLTNPAAIALVGKTVKIIGGTGAGQTASITGYDPELRRFTIGTNWTFRPRTKPAIAAGGRRIALARM
jgi:hypothetical protein